MKIASLILSTKIIQASQFGALQFFLVAVEHDKLDQVQNLLSNYGISQPLAHGGEFEPLGERYGMALFRFQTTKERLKSGLATLDEISGEEKLNELLSMFGVVKYDESGEVKHETRGRKAKTVEFPSEPFSIAELSAQLGISITPILKAVKEALANGTLYVAQTISTGRGRPKTIYAIV